MARTLGIVKTTIWGDEDFRALRRDEQRAYLLLISQPQINNCGVLPYVPRRWAKLALDDEPANLIAALAVLQEARFVVVDEDTEEICVRTFVKHDRIETQPRLLEAAKREFKEIESREIRQTLRSEYPAIFAEIHDPRPLGQGVLEGVAEGVGQGVGEGVNVRARADADAPSPSSRREEETSVFGPKLTTPRPSTTTEDPAAGVELEAPRESRVAEVVDGLRGSDRESFNQLWPLAAQLSSAAFETVVDRLGRRREVANPTGLLRWLLEQEVGQQIRAATAELRANGFSPFIPSEPPPDLEGFVRDFAGSWQVATFEEAFAKWKLDEQQRIPLVDLAVDLIEERSAASPAP